MGDGRAGVEGREREVKGRGGVGLSPSE